MVICHFSFTLNQAFVDVDQCPASQSCHEDSMSYYVASTSRYFINGQFRLLLVLVIEKDVRGCSSLTTLGRLSLPKAITWNSCLRNYSWPTRDLSACVLQSQKWLGICLPHPLHRWGNSQCRAPQARIHLEFSRSSELDWSPGSEDRVDEVREVMGGSRGLLQALGGCSKAFGFSPA